MKIDHTSNLLNIRECRICKSTFQCKVYHLVDGTYAFRADLVNESTSIHFEFETKNASIQGNLNKLRKLIKKFKS